MDNTQKTRDIITHGITSPEIAKQIEFGVERGYLHTRLIEPALPKYDYDPGDGEVVLENDNGSFIVLSRDRMGNHAHGKGGIEGGTDCAAIDIVAGRLSGAGRRRKKSATDPIETGGNPALDGARVYLTERGEVDKYFGLPKGKRSTMENRSGVVIKADYTRVVGRRGVKIVAGRSSFEGVGLRGEKDSKGAVIKTNQFIEFIANQNDDLQPLVKGEALIICLRAIYDEIAATRTALYNTHIQQAKLAGALMLVPGMVGPALENLLKNYIFAIDDILKGIKTQLMKVNYTGVGDPENRVQGGKKLFDKRLKDVLSKHVYTT